MVTRNVDGTDFNFPVGWEAEVYDEWPQTRKLSGSTLEATACDIVAIGDGTLYLIEAKDYTFPVGTRPPSFTDLAKTVTKKAFHTLGGLVLAAKLDIPQADFSRRAICCDAIQLHLSVELPTDKGLLHNRQKFMTEIQDLLRKQTRPFLPHKPVVSSHSATSHVPWTAKWSGGRAR